MQPRHAARRQRVRRVTEQRAHLGRALLRLQACPAEVAGVCCRLQACAPAGCRRRRAPATAAAKSWSRPRAWPPGTREG
eukprot:scaffold41377_cov48-Phaeocystis_antarctica.AAC.2